MSTASLCQAKLIKNPLTRTQSTESQPLLSASISVSSPPPPHTEKRNQSISFCIKSMKIKVNVRYSTIPFWVMRSYRLVFLYDTGLVSDDVSKMLLAMKLYHRIFSNHLNPLFGLSSDNGILRLNMLPNLIFDLPSYHASIQSYFFRSYKLFIWCCFRLRQCCALH